MHTLYNLILSTLFNDISGVKKMMQAARERIFDDKRRYRYKNLRNMAPGHEASERCLYDDMVTFFCDHNVGPICVVKIRVKLMFKCVYILVVQNDLFEEGREGTPKDVPRPPP